MSLEYFLYIASVAAIILAVWAQVKVSSTFRKFAKTSTATNRTADEVARMILDNNGLHHVKIERVRGSLSDHFDPRSNTLRLSDSVYGNRSAAAIGVAAHEAGHAIQHATGYAPVVLRSKMVPITSFASRFTWIVIVFGILFMGTVLGYYALHFGIALFAITTIFQLVTLPVEFNASRRALATLTSAGILSDSEKNSAKKVLSAAAMTYVAALAVSLVQLLRLILIFGGGRRRD
jgi:Zn-dependent membrane protease YugP